MKGNKSVEKKTQNIRHCCLQLYDVNKQLWRHHPYIKTGVDWMHLAWNGHQRLAFVNTLMNLRGSIKCGEFLDQTSDCQLVKKDSAPWN
jgi:hypothetical protein